MKVLLILKKGRPAGTKVIVKLHTKSLKDRVIALLGQGKKEEAFDIIASKALWEAFVPESAEPSIKPDLTLAEDD